MSAQQDLVRLRDSAAQWAGRVLGHPAHQLLDPRLVADIGRHLELLEQAALAPVRVGFAGGFSTGKSVLLGALLGLGDLLPASAPATTAVITEIHPRPGPDVLVDERAEVRFLSRRQVEEYRDRLVSGLAAESGRPAPSDRASWPALTDWCREILWPTGLVETRVREFLALRDAAISFDWLPDREPLDLEWATVRRNLVTIELDNGPPNWMLPPPARIPTTGFDPDILRRSSRLVERVVVGVQVPERFWPLERTRIGDDVVLLDTPGRGGTSAKVRDDLLLINEMPVLDALVVMCDPMRPDADDVQQLLREFVAAGGERGLVVINRFNLAEVGQSALQSGTGPITEADLLADPAYATLRAVWQTATSLGTDTPAAAAETAITSVVAAWALGRTQDRPPVPLPAGKTEAEWKQEIAEQAGRWRELASRMQPAHGTLATALTDYAADGGLARLRGLLSTQTVRVGVARKSARVRRLHDELEQLCATAMIPLREWDASVEDSETQARHRLEQQFIDAKISLNVTLERCNVDVFTQTFTLSGGRSGPEEVNRRVLEDVFGWTAWGRLWDSVHSQELRGGGSGMPRTTDALLPAFRESVERAHLVGVEVADRMVARWAAVREREMADQLDDLIDVFEAIGPVLDERHQPVRDWLGDAVQTEWLLDPAEAPEPRETAAPEPARTADELFPLRLGRGLPWADERTGDQQRLHQMQIIRVRNELAAAAVRAGHRALAGRLKELVSRVRRLLDGHQNAWFELTDLQKRVVDTAYPSKIQAEATSPEPHRDDPIKPQPRKKV
ncbi:hypothetical protein [Kineosporia babensis]|uniref:Dynamin family protein n=1 Tax=Kineosporia babensis TaxID=499548 RepID=A0A9X1NDZ6_9ACTN|nr:hypothetical protein [Kineosporia babensis]MCD5312034.1 hypothetical protein [Kineosporia babensis]